LRARLSIAWPQLWRLNLQIPAAQYLRMSTEHQQYSLLNQAAKIQEYATQHGFEVVKSYTDAGRSGVLLKYRNALSSLLAEVMSHSVDFKVILVYDVSRWGRFQDTDEAAHYEFLCKSAGVPVLYCAEQFVNDSSIPSSIMKTLKRTMAAEFSRELGVKVFAGKVRLVREGFRSGGGPGYGLRRMLLSETGESKGLLGPGDHKSYAKDRVVLVPGPEHEQAVIRRIYDLMFHKVRCKRIADRLNSENTPFVAGRQWNYWSVLEVLRNPKYAGWNVWATTDQKLYGPTRRITKDKWVTCEHAFTPVIDPDTFQRMQMLLDDHRVYSDEEMFAGLRKVLQKHGKISRALIRATKGIPCETQYYRRFGNLQNAYERIGYEQTQGDFTYSEHRTHSEALRDALAVRIADALPQRVVVQRRNLKVRPTLLVDGIIRVDILICPFRLTTDTVRRWFFYPHRKPEATDFTLACLLTRDDTKLARLYLVPGSLWRHMYKATDFENIGTRLRKLSDLPECFLKLKNREENKRKEKL
jgi:DNA invertase Pin-like site-specific DNA recombinase